ncbi:hypothetical protein [Marispirochaeta sp.]|uniref:hypothetical protein n=1 Tax=Marispirochaeta sp. TaxID=2038653 RepID=UPI0029C67037|nr:hypothetical protein [Marispirochaeta sp.]
MHDSNSFRDKMAKGYDIQALKTYSKAYHDTIELSKKYLDTDQTALDLGCGTGITTLELVSFVKKILHPKPVNCFFACRNRPI